MAPVAWQGQLPPRQPQPFQRITECDSAGEFICTQIFNSSVEVCDAIDNDYDGIIDNGATCLDEGICHNGRCVKNCSSGEFPCQEAYTICDFASGLCVSENCIGITCNAEQVCRNSECVAPCDGVVCPWGQTCIGDVCLDPCEGVTCAVGQIYRGGTCFDGCGQRSGATCVAPLRCDTTSGECYHPSCDPACSDGEHCESGSCVSNCEGAVCPGDAPCVDGQCQAPGTIGDGGFAGCMGDSGGSGGGPLLDAGTDDAAPEGGKSVYNPEDNSGCGCHLPGRAPVSGAAVLALLGLLLARRRRQ